METDVNHYIPGAELRPRFSVLTVLTKVYAAANHSLYQYAWGLLRNILPSTCNEDWLPVWAKILNVTRKEATAATGQVTFSGTGTIPAGTELQSTEGYSYTTQDTNEVDQVINVSAAETGAIQNTNTTTLTIKHPISGIDNTVTVTTEIAGGSDIETIASWRTRISEKFADRQKIGDSDDYTALVKEIDSTIRYVWIYENTPDLGQITIVCALPGTNPVPTASQLVELKTQLDRKRNVSAEVILSAPQFSVVPFEISRVPVESQSTITEALIELFNSLRDQDETLYISDIHATIRQVYGGTYSLLAPTADIAAAPQTLLTMSDISWA